METHYWLFPWLSLFASLSGAAGSLFLCRRNPSKVDPTPISVAVILVWLVGTAVLVLGGLKVGDWAAVDYIPARGILAGAAGGFLLALIVRRQIISPAARTGATIGLTTALICAARLWLTHGELSGLIATVLSTGITLLCLVAFSALFAKDSYEMYGVVAILIYATTLVGAILLGFTRVDALGDIYWADIPIMFGAALSIGLFVAAAFEKYGIAAKATAVIISVGAIIASLAIAVAHSMAVLELPALGLAAVALPLVVFRKSASQELPQYLGALLIIAAVTVAFTALSGYGLALLILGAISAALIAFSAGIETPPGWLAFGALLVIYRLELLQNVSSTRSIGPGNMWDLLAIGIGVLLPRALTAWLTDYVHKPTWWTSAQWLMSICAPAIALDYIWQPRTLTGLFLGLAIGQLVGTSKIDQRKAEITCLSSLLVSLLLFIFLPGIDELSAPTRGVRITCIAVLALIMMLKIATHRAQPMVSAEAA